MSRPHRRRIVAAAMSLVLALSLTGCATGAGAFFGSTEVRQGQVEVPPQPEPVDDEPATRPIDPGRVTIEDHGAEPRELLTLGARAGAVQSLTVSQSGHQSFALAGEIAETSFPTMSVEVELVVVEAGGDGLQVDATVHLAEATAADGTPIEQSADPLGGETGGAGATDQVTLAETSSLLQGMAGSTHRIAVDHHGGIVGAEPVLGDGFDYEALIVGYVERNILSLADPIPAEPLGLGATWTVVSDGLAEGIPTTVARRYQIVEIGPESIRASVSRTVTYEAGTYLDTQVLAGSVLTGEGQAIWPRGGVVGYASYGLEGVLGYGLPDNHELAQSVTRIIDSQSTMLNLPASPDPTPEPLPGANQGANDAGNLPLDEAAEPTPGASIGDLQVPTPGAEPSVEPSPEPTANPLPTVGAGPDPTPEPLPTAGAGPDPTPEPLPTVGAGPDPTPDPSPTPEADSAHGDGETS